MKDGFEPLRISAGKCHVSRIVTSLTDELLNLIENFINVVVLACIKGDARMFGGEGDRGDVHASAVPQPSRPGALAKSNVRLICKIHACMDISLPQQYSS